MPTTVEELPAGFWDDDGAGRDADAPSRAVRDAGPAEPPPAPPAPPPRDPGEAAEPAGGPPALASLQGLALLQAVFPGRVVKVERAATADDDAAPDAAAVADPIDAPDDDPDPGADAPPPRTP